MARLRPKMVLPVALPLTSRSDNLRFAMFLFLY
jgi:hypothetical protein